MCAGAVMQQTVDHGAHFLRAADWLVEAQDDMGGWPVPVQRVLAGRLRLPPGWHSAMAQGHAISVLTRAYLLTKQTRFIQAATNALHLFEVPASEGGKLLIRSLNVWLRA